MKQYQDMLRHILANGAGHDDRTGTGTTRVFGYQMRFDLSEGFPLLTTKKMWFRGVVEELRWFLRGETNVNTLPKAVQKWWLPWALEDGELGPIYGEQMRRSRWWGRPAPRIYEPHVPPKVEGGFCGVGDLGILSGRRLGPRPDDPVDSILKPTWRDMIKRCYDTNSKAYPAYGAVGVHMDPTWLHYPAFRSDAQKLEGWPLKLDYPDEYSLDKDLHRSNRYGPDTCIWLSRMEQSLNTSTNMPFTAVDPDGVEHLFPSLGDALRNYGLNIGALHRCLNGKLHTHHGWHSFRYSPDDAGTVRFREVDQLKSVLAQLRHDPNSRRMVINLWATPAMGVARLPCCHGAIIQFAVMNGKLSCQMYQRSADAFVGVPVNIASYALLTHMLAYTAELEVGDFIHTFGDLHIYNNHREQVEEQLSREPRALPKLLIHRKGHPSSQSDLETLLSINYDGLRLTGYEPHPPIKAEVSV